MTIFSFTDHLHLLLNILINIDNIYETNDEYNPNKQRKIWIVFNDIIAYMFSNVKRQPIIIIYKR